MTLTGLTRVDLLPSEKAQFAAAAFANQQFGAKSETSRRFNISRPTVYNASETAETVLTDYFVRCEQKLGGRVVVVDDRQLERAMVALRVVSPNSLRAIETLIPILYPGGHVSYAAIQGTLAEAERRAKEHNASQDLTAVKAGALDEMFSQGDPVLAGVDLDTTYLFALALRATRSGADWADVLGQGQQQGLELEIAVKDAARGIAAGVREVYPDCEQRDDCFHALYEMGKVRVWLERRAVGAISREYDAAAELEAQKKAIRGSRSQLAKKVQDLVKARKCRERLVALHDAFEQFCREAADAMEFADAVTGELRQPEQMRSRLEAVGERMRQLDEPKCKRVGRYIINRASGLASHMVPVIERFAALSVCFGAQAVRNACIAYRNAIDLQKRRQPWDAADQKARLRAAIYQMESQAGDRADNLFAHVDLIIQQRHRASSAIEGFNAALRPYLYVHKGVTQGFLELFRAYYNLRVRRWGRHKGTTAHQCLTGEEVGDWLTRLGYPPGEIVLH